MVGTRAMSLVLLVIDKGGDVLRLCSGLGDSGTVGSVLGGGRVVEGWVYPLASWVMVCRGTAPPSAAVTGSGSGREDDISCNLKGGCGYRDSRPRCATRGCCR